MKTNKTEINCSSRAVELIKANISYTREEVWLLCLTSVKTPIALIRVFVGTLDSCSFHPRDIFRTCILKNAHSFILFHSHPSGDPTPSAADIELTKNLKKASKLMQIQLLDHIIVCKNSHSSFKNLSLLK